MFIFNWKTSLCTTFAAVALLATAANMGTGTAAHATELSVPGLVMPEPKPEADPNVNRGTAADCLSPAPQSDSAAALASPHPGTEVDIVARCAMGRTALTVPAETKLPDSPATLDQVPSSGQAFGLTATLYITTARDSGHDSIGCNVIPMRTVAVDGHIVKRHSVLFIKETVGLRMPDGSIHDGYWYATDVGSAIHVGRIDLYSGKGVRTIRPLLHLNLKTLTVTRVGRFVGCPSHDGAQALPDIS